MLDDNRLKKILDEIEKNNLFEEFVINLFDYDKNNILKSIIRYKIDDNFIIDIYNNINTNTFVRYCFLNQENDICIEENNDNNILIVNIYINSCYNKKNSNNKLILFAKLFKEQNKKNINISLNKIFNEKIILIFKKYLNC